MKPCLTTSLEEIWAALDPAPPGVLNQFDTPETGSPLTATIFLPMQCRLVGGIFLFIFLSIICLEKYTYNFTSFYSFKGLWSRRRFDYSSPCHPNNNVTYVIWSTSKISKLAPTSNTFRYEFSHIVTYGTGRC